LVGLLAVQGLINNLKIKKMKNLALMLLIFISTTAFPQNQTQIIVTDTILYKSDTVFHNWYHDSFVDSDVPFQLVSYVFLVKTHVTDSNTTSKRYHKIAYILSENDSLLNPSNGIYYGYQTVKNIIYTSNENMKRTLSKFHILNDKDRLMK